MVVGYTIAAHPPLKNIQSVITADVAIPGCDRASCGGFRGLWAWRSVAACAVIRQRVRFLIQGGVAVRRAWSVRRGADLPRGGLVATAARRDPPVGWGRGEVKWG